MNIEYPVACPLMAEMIGMGTCFDIHNVVSGEAPPWTAPEEAVNRENFREICKTCQYHRED